VTNPPASTLLAPAMAELAEAHVSLNAWPATPKAAAADPVAAPASLSPPPPPLPAPVVVVAAALAADAGRFLPASDAMRALVRLQVTPCLLAPACLLAGWPAGLALLNLSLFCRRYCCDPSH
jgi:hypothetical protein